MNTNPIAPGKKRTREISRHIFALLRWNHFPYPIHSRTTYWLPCSTPGMSKKNKITLSFKPYAYNRISSKTTRGNLEKIPLLPEVISYITRLNGTCDLIHLESLGKVCSCTIDETRKEGFICNGSLSPSFPLETTPTDNPRNEYDACHANRKVHINGPRWELELISLNQRFTNTRGPRCRHLMAGIQTSENLLVRV